jgi:hypothetical protein
VPDAGITREHVAERRADLDRQLAVARQQAAAAQLMIQAIDGAIQENNYYVGLIAEQEKRKQHCADPDCRICGPLAEPREKAANAL